MSVSPVSKAIMHSFLCRKLSILPEFLCFDQNTNFGAVTGRILEKFGFVRIFVNFDLHFSYFYCFLWHLFGKYWLKSKQDNQKRVQTQIFPIFCQWLLLGFKFLLIWALKMRYCTTFYLKGPRKYDMFNLKLLDLLNENKFFNFDQSFFWCPLRYSIIQCLIWQLLILVNWSQEVWGVAALLHCATPCAKYSF